MKNISRKQGGLTLISLILLLGLIGVFVMLVLKIGPIYMDHSKVKSALAEIKGLNNLETKSEYEIRDSLRKRLDMNYVTQVKPENIKILKSGNYMKLEINYEVVEKIAGNLSALVQFNDVVEVGHE